MAVCWFPGPDRWLGPGGAVGDWGPRGHDVRMSTFMVWADRRNLAG